MRPQVESCFKTRFYNKKALSVISYFLKQSYKDVKRETRNDEI